MAAPVAIQGAKYPLPLDHFFQARHHRDRRFLFYQLGVVDLAAGIVQDDDQVRPALILEPAMAATIDVQEHARQRTPGSSFAMHPAFPSPLYPPGSLQGQLHPGVAELNLVLLPQLLVKMPHVQIEIPRDTVPVPAPPGPAELVSATGFLVGDRTTRHSQTPGSAPANDACAGR